MANLPNKFSMYIVKINLLVIKVCALLFTWIFSRIYDGNKNFLITLVIKTNIFFAAQWKIE